MMDKYLEGMAYVSAFAVIGLTYLDCLLTIAGRI
jgi:hypothetical protein